MTSPKTFSYYIFTLLLVALPLVSMAQRTTDQKKKTATTQTTQKRTATTPKKKGTTSSSSGKNVSKRGRENRKSATKATAVPETQQIKKLKGERQALKQKIHHSERQLNDTRKNVRVQLNGLLMLNTQIQDQQQRVSQIASEIKQLSANIGQLQSLLDTLKVDLTLRKNKYAKSLEYLHRNRMTQSNLLFVLSARSFRELRRRLRYVRAFAKNQREQGERIRQEEALVREKEAELRGVKQEKDLRLTEGRTQQAKLQQQHTERQQIVEKLNQQQDELQRTIAAHRAKATALDAQIDRMIQAEIAAAAARRKAEAERQRKIALAAARQKAAAEAKRKAAAEAERQRKEAERQRKETERKRREEQRLRQEAEAAKAKGKTEEARKKNEAAARAKAQAAQAEKAERAAERAAQKAEKTSTSATPTFVEPDNTDRQLSASFEANRGRLYAPISGAYAITSRYGAYSVEGLRGVQLDNKGINLTARQPAAARAIFQGEVSTIFSYGGMYNVIVRHGAYMSVYCNLSSVSVRRGQHVTTGQHLGSVAADGNGGYTLHFQLRRETARLNPEGWFR